MKANYIALLFAPTLLLAGSYEAMMPRTSNAQIEVKDLPPVQALEVDEDGSYFADDNKAFRKLFRYISTHDVAMTVPVTADVPEGKMRFFVGSEDQKKALHNDKNVQVVTIPGRKVASIGYNGAYNEQNYQSNLTTLQTWLKQNEHLWKITGEPVAVYWDGPFKLPAWKRAEIHIPVAPVQPVSDSSPLSQSQEDPCTTGCPTAAGN